ncbi:MAG: hypothetical protein ACOY99_00185 [Pseudomonadota bacterium]
MSTPAEYPTATHFTVAAAVEPAVLPRVLGFFAQANTVPARVKSRVFAAGDLVIDIDIVGLVVRPKRINPSVWEKGTT